MIFNNNKKFKKKIFLILFYFIFSLFLSINARISGKRLFYYLWSLELRIFGNEKKSIYLEKETNNTVSVFIRVHILKHQMGFSNELLTIEPKFAANPM
jgi:hypothetical protein